VAWRSSSQSSASGGAPPDAGARYGLEFDLESIPRLCEEHGLTFAMPGD